MSWKNNSNYQNFKQPYLFIINSIHDSFKLEKYEKDLQQFLPIMKFCFIATFVNEDQKLLLGFKKDIVKETLYQILKKDISVSQLIQIPQLPEDEYINFPDKIAVCPIPKCFYNNENFKLFLSKFYDDFTIDNQFDFRIIQTKNTYYSFIFYQFLNNLAFRDLKPSVVKSQIDPLPIIFVSNIPKGIEREDIQEMFDYYLKERALTISSDNNNDSDFYNTRITLKNVEIAERAIEMFNFAQIDGHEIYANIYFPYINHIYEMKSWKLRIEGIPEDLTSRQLHQAFSRFGKIYKAFVKSPSDSPSYGSVQYFDQNVALDVEKKVDQATLNGCKINVFQKRKIIINNFSSITKEQVQEYFSDFHPSSIKIKNYNEEKRLDVLITFRSDSDAKNAIELALDMQSMGMYLYADFDQSNKNIFPEDESIYLSNLPSNFTQIQLIDLCSVYGMLRRAKIIPNKSNENFVSGIVTFKSQESAKEALINMEGFELDCIDVNVVPYVSKKKY